MLKILALFALIYVFFKALGMIVRTVIGPDVNRHDRFRGNQNQQQRKEGDVRVEYDPNKKKGYDGGEYVDYEEVD